MEPLPRLKARINSLGELRDIIRALRGLAASHVQEAQEALAGIRSYVHVIEDAISEAAALLPDGLDQPAAGNGAPRDALILVCSEHGFVGGYNERLLARARELLKPRQDLVVLGSRGVNLAAEQGLDVQESFEMATHVGGVLGLARRVASSLADRARASILFASYRSGANSELEFKEILPLSASLMAGSRRKWPPLHHLAPAELLRSLSEEYLLAEITHALTEALASENGARLRATEAADGNIGERLGSLKIQEFTLRQEAITTELLDVVTGSQAQSPPGGGGPL